MALPGSLSVVSQMPKVVCSTSNLTAGFPRLVARTLRIVEISPLIGPLAWTVRLGVDSRRKISRPSAALTRARSTPNGNPSRFTSTVHRPVAVPLEPGSIPVAVEPVGREGPGTIFRPTIRRPRLLTKGRIGDGERPRVIQGQRWRFSIPRGPLASLGGPSTATPSRCTRAKNRKSPSKKSKCRARRFRSWKAREAYSAKKTSTALE